MVIFFSEKWYTKKVLVIEDLRLSYRDQLRNLRLFEWGWDVKRFWVYQITENIDWYIDQINRWSNDHH